MDKKTTKQDRLQKMLVSRCHGSGTAYERYEDCKDMLKEAEREKIIAGSDWNDWVRLVTAVLGI